MASFGGPRVHFVACTTARKRRSSISRQPRVVSDTFLNSTGFVTSPSHGVVHGNIEDEKIKNFGNGLGKANTLKLRLKLGGVTRTVHTSSSSELVSGGVQQLCSHQYASHGQENSLFKAKGCGLPSNESSKTGPSYERDRESKMAISANEAYKCEPVRKSKRVPKWRDLDVGFDNGDGDDDEDEEIQYLGRLNALNSLQSDEDWENISSKRDGLIHEEIGYFEGLSDDEPESKRRQQGKESIQIFLDGRNYSTPTAHSRTLQTGKVASSGPGAGVMEHPDGLPPHKKHKGNPSELEQQLKRAEAAHRRRVQAEKAAREAEAEAIRKILGQDSGRKKKEDKVKQQQDELAKVRAVQAETLEPKTIRWVMGPNGTIIIFPKDIGLPPIFNSVPCRYPPAREKCAGPNCTNTYRYRDSKSKLPLCSLGCYKAIHEKMPHVVAC